ncbi:type III-A CRISPR-associated CARF protein Csm6 [Diplocloster agilis]|uniref:CRISPR-associated protein Csm6 n=1 Tax=Diplocloster agilis TaxID=2850323 RepID=A0A949NFP9_9FIRM|nr:hypothetical protein [Diplocloster agilis]MBU9735438.1 hypothetical protein [Diplocloster agilis]
MKKNILFSAVSGTDPISKNSDGPLLHICRKYRPTEIYLYLSKEMLELHRRDDRYCLSLNKLGEKLGCTFTIEVIERPELDNPHVFDIFYKEFRSILNNIWEKHEGEDFDFLLNVSSGTPAMEAALQTLAAFGENKYIPIQVTSPAKGGNFPKEDFIIEKVWATNKDNEEKYCDRSVVSENLNLVEEIRYGIIRRHLKVYDYIAANTVANTCNHLSDVILAMLEASEDRFRLDLDKVEALQKQYDFNFMPTTDARYQMNIEYLLTLDIKRKRKEYVDFIRGVTPINLDLLEIYLSNILNINIKDYCETFASGKVCITQRKLKKTEKGRDVLEKLEGGFKKGAAKGYNDRLPYSSEHLRILIESYGNDRNVFAMVAELRTVEIKVRNLAAHVIICLTEDKIKKECGKSPDDIMNILWGLARKAGIIQNEDIQSSYRNMNDQIIQEIYSGNKNVSFS